MSLKSFGTLCRSCPSVHAHKLDVDFFNFHSDMVHEVLRQCLPPDALNAKLDVAPSAGIACFSILSEGLIDCLDVAALRVPILSHPVYDFALLFVSVLLGFGESLEKP